MKPSSRCEGRWRTCVALVLACATAAQAAAPVVSHVRAGQRPGTKWVDITYDLAADRPVEIVVQVSDNGGASYGVAAIHFSGPGYGSGVAPGQARQIAWDAGRDWAGQFSANVVFKVTAHDRQPPETVPTGMVWIPPGALFLGSPTNELVRRTDEALHPVMISGFYMSRYELTQAEYLAVMSNNPSRFVPAHGYTEDLQRPVESVTWYDATNYCGQLNVREGRLGSGWVYRLPTEAEWEYACRAGTTTPFHYGEELRSGMANFDGHDEYPPGPGELFYHHNPGGIYLGRTTPVGNYQPNAWGLYDMHGNVWEWCLDWYGAYPSTLTPDWRGPASGSYRVFRGGFYYSDGFNCRSAQRNSYRPDYWYYSLGFRPVLAPEEP